MTIQNTLRAAGLSPTAGRVAVFTALKSGKCLSAAAVVRKARGVPPATVYRALSSLCDAGLISRVPGERSALYMRADSHAAQLICARCGKVEEVNSPEVRRYHSTLKKDRGGDGALLMVADCARKECDS